MTATMERTTMLAEITDMDRRSEPCAELPNYLTVVQTAEALGVTERRVRQWQSLGIFVPATRKGLLQYRRYDVVRGAVLQHLQGIFGESSTLAVDLAKALTPEQLESFLGSDSPQLTAAMPGRIFRVDLDPEGLAQVRNRLATVPV